MEDASLGWMSKQEFFKAHAWTFIFLIYIDDLPNNLASI